MVEGQVFYKKFSNNQSISTKAFDPLHAERSPPEMCGYGIRLFQLLPNLTGITIKQNLRNAAEMQIPIATILKPIIPQTTLDIIKEQKKKNDRNQRSSNNLNAM